MSPSLRCSSILLGESMVKKCRVQGPPGHAGCDESTSQWLGGLSCPGGVTARLPCTHTHSLSHVWRTRPAAVCDHILHVFKPQPTLLPPRPPWRHKVSEVSLWWETCWLPFPYLPSSLHVALFPRLTFGFGLLAYRIKKPMSHSDQE